MDTAVQYALSFIKQGLHVFISLNHPPWRAAVPISQEAEWSQSLLGGYCPLPQAGRSGAPRSKTSSLPHPSPSHSL